MRGARRWTRASHAGRSGITDRVLTSRGCNASPRMGGIAPMSRQSTPHSTSHGASLKDMVQLHLVILAWGFTAILGKLITLPPVEVTVWRTALAAWGLTIIALVSGISLRLPTRIALQLLGTGCIIGWHWM